MRNARAIACLLALAAAGCGGSTSTEEEPTPIPAVCGNDAVEGLEACDDGNTADGDGCSATCEAEFDFTLQGRVANVAGCAGGIENDTRVTFDTYASSITAEEIDANNCRIDFVAENFGQTRTGAAIFEDGVTFRHALLLFGLNVAVPFACERVGITKDFLEDTLLLSTFHAIFFGPPGSPPAGPAATDKALSETMQCIATGDRLFGDFATDDVSGTLECRDVDDNDSCAFDIVFDRFSPEFDMTLAILSAVGGGPEPGCGDGVVQAGEACDDGNNASGDGCSATCEREVCGDGVLQTGLGEECDDGNTADGDGCSADCAREFKFRVAGSVANVAGCGGAVAAGNTVTFDTFATRVLPSEIDASNCKVEFLAEEFGATAAGVASFGAATPFTLPIIIQSLVLGIPSPCDDVGSQANFLETSAILSSYEFLFVAPSATGGKRFGESIQCAAGTEDFTGDFRTGDVDGTLHCDDADGGDSCTFDVALTEYTPLFDMSGAILAALGGPPPVTCGDGALEGTEECDDGNNRSDDGCSANCLVEECGDGIVQPGLGETCDDGNTAGGDGCSEDCMVEACGDGSLDDGEECDDGNLESGDGCSSACAAEFCGDGVLQVGLDEECDDGNAVALDGCSTTCARDLPFTIAGTIGGVDGCAGAIANGDAARFDVFASSVRRRALAVGICGARFLAEEFGEVPAGTVTFETTAPFAHPIILFDFDLGIPFDCSVLGGIDNFLQFVEVLSFFSLAFVEGASPVPGKALAENVQCTAGTEDFSGNFPDGNLAGTLSCEDSDGNGTCAFTIATSQFETGFDLRQAIRVAPLEP